MRKVLINETNLQEIAKKKKKKNGSSDTYTPAQMSTAIRDIPIGTSSDFDYIIFSTDTTYFDNFYQVGKPNYLFGVTNNDCIIYLDSEDGWLYHKPLTETTGTRLTQICYVTYGKMLYLTCANIGNGQLYMSVSNGSETIMTKTSMNNTLRSKGISDTIKAFVLGIGNVQNIQAIPQYLFG